MKYIRSVSFIANVSAVALAAVVVLLPLSKSLADVTGTLFPNGQGTYTSWQNTENQINETGTPDCGTGSNISENATSSRESVNISLSSVPNNATIQSVTIMAYDRGDSAAGGTYQTFTRLNGTNQDSGTNIAATGTSGCNLKTQTIDVVDVIKTATTTLEVGVLKTGANNNRVRVGAIRAVITYAPLTHTITTATGVGGTMTPGGPVTVNDGVSQTFTIAPGIGNIVANVSVDSISQGRLNSYLFTNVTANHSISATFENGWTAPTDSTDNDGDVIGDPNVFSSNDSYAAFDNSSDEMDVDDFGFSIPAGATIDGIEVAVEGNRTSGRTLDVALSWNDGSTYTSVKNIGSTFNGSDRTVIAGGPSDTWGRTWSSTEFSNANFRVLLGATSGGGDINVDQVQVKIHYTLAGTLVVKKSVINDNGGVAATSSFSFQVDGGAPIAFEADGQNDIIVSAGSHTVTEVAADGYGVSYDNCSAVSVAGNGTTTCTITNNDEPGTLRIVKNALGGDGVFNFSLTQGSSTIDAPSIDTAEDSDDYVDIQINANTNYTVDEPSVPEGWDFTGVTCEYDGSSAGNAGPAPTSHVVSVDSGETVTCTYVNTKRASLTITKLTDPATGEFQFNLAGPAQNGIPASTTFSPSGEWTVSNLLPGTYSVSETVPDGWTGAQQMACNGNGDNDPQGSITSAFELTLAPGEVMSCVANNTQDAIVSGQKFEDTDGSGVSSTGMGLSGWQIEFALQDDPETPSTTESGSWQATTNDDGIYMQRLQPGTYRVCEIQESGWYQSYPTAETENATECVDGAGYLLTVAAGNNVSGIDFGNYRNGTIAGFKWNDLNGNGILEDGEPGLSGWQIELRRDALLVDTQTTAGGVFQFTGVAPGAYTLREVMQPGWAQSFPGGIGELFAATISNGAVVNKNFGNVEDATISGKKWNDLNGNGAFEEGEPSLSGWVIYADLNGNGAKDDNEPTDTTDGSGLYKINGLLPGTYTVREVQQSGWGQTFPSSTSHSVTLGVNQDVTGIDFGNAQTVGISGKKWNDKNANAIQDPTFTCVVIIPETPCTPFPGPLEPGIEGWTITATPILEGGVVDGSRIVKQAATDNLGNYAFSFLPAEFGQWRLTEEQRSGWTQTFPTSSSFYDVTIAADSSYGSYDFGNWENATVEVSKWNDVDNDGNRDQDEAIISSWPMALGRVIGEGEGSTTQVKVVAVALTNSSGTASLLAPAPGQYIVLEGSQDGWTRTYPASRNGNLSLAFASGVTSTALATDSFYNVSVEAGMSGQTITEGQIPGGEGMVTLALAFGNHQETSSIPQGPTNTIIGEFGGGSGPQNGSAGGGQVLGAATTTEGNSSASENGSNVLGSACKLPITTFIRRNGKNDPGTVKELQNFLNTELRLDPPLPLTGYFGPLTEVAVKQFQVKYYDEILKPWVDLGLLPANTPTGIVYKLTLWKIQKLGCPDMDVMKPSLP